MNARLNRPYSRMYHLPSPFPLHFPFISSLSLSLFFYVPLNYFGSPYRASSLLHPARRTLADDVFVENTRKWTEWFTIYRFGLPVFENQPLRFTSLSMEIGIIQRTGGTWNKLELCVVHRKEKLLHFLNWTLLSSFGEEGDVELLVFEREIVLRNILFFIYYLRGSREILDWGYLVV